MSRNKRVQGFALMVVLMAATVLAMLSTSLVSLNRSGFLSLSQYEQRAQAMQACYAGLDYARARLAQVPNWGVGAFGTNTTVLDNNEILVEEQGQLPNDNLVAGLIKLSGSSFSFQVCNNLSSAYSAPAPTFSQSKMNLTPRSALVAVEGRCGNAQRRIEVLLVRKTGVGGAIYAGHDLAVKIPSGATGKVLTFSSTVPKSNLVKVNATARLPDPTKMEFRSSGGRGRLQSGGDTIVNSTFDFANGQVVNISDPGEGLSGNGALTSQVSSEIKATVTPSSPPAPPKFRPDQLKQPASAPPSLPGGHYHFVDHETVSYKATPTSNPVTYTKYILVNGARVDLSEYRFMPQGNLSVSGNLRLSGEANETVYNSNGLPISQQIRDVPVTLAVGYDKLGLPLSYSALGGYSTTKSRLTVVGNVRVDGDLVGSGQIFVQKNTSGTGGNIEVIGNSFLSATRTDGMALVAEGSVEFKEVETTTSTQLFAMLPSEFPLYADAVDPISDYPQAIQDTFNNWRGTGNIGDAVGNSDTVGGGTLRSARISTAAYASVLDQMLPSGQTPGGKNLNTLFVPMNLPAPTGGGYILQGLTAREAIDNFMLQVQSSGGMTLGLHTRLREFIKSLDRTNPDGGMINLANPTEFDSYNDTIKTLVANQMSAYNQDARTAGKHLLGYLAGPNPYQESQRRDFIFGGLLYAYDNVYTRLASRFNLLGSMISEKTMGFDNLRAGTIVYDPNSFEDQFDIAKLGLGPAFFWTGP